MPVDIGAVLSAGEAIVGTVQSVTGAAKAKRLLAQRTAYKTPDEFLKILNATENMSQQGYDAFSLSFLKNSIDQSFDQSLSSAEKYGAYAGFDPNVLSAIFTKKVNALGEVADKNHALMMENFGKYLSALNVTGENKAAEWQSQQDIIKDKLQAAVGGEQQGAATLNNGLNSLLSLLSSGKMDNLFKSGSKDSATTGHP